MSARGFLIRQLGRHAWVVRVPEGRRPICTNSKTFATVYRRTKDAQAIVDSVGDFRYRVVPNRTDQKRSR